MRETLERLLDAGRRAERRDPKLRPPDAVPIEFVLLGYPVLDLPPIPGGGDVDDDGSSHDAAQPSG